MRSVSFRKYAAVIVLFVLFIPAVSSLAEYPVIFSEDISVIADEGVALKTMVARPDADGSFPTVLIRSPYGSQWSKNSLMEYAKRGVAAVFQETRGRHGSGGTFIPFVYGVADGGATMRWIRSQEWSNGEIGATGHSYVGFTALYLTAGDDAPPKSIVAHNPVVSPRGGLYRGGAMNHHFDLYWSLLVDGTTLNLDYIFEQDWERLFSVLPLNDGHSPVGRDIPFYRDWTAWANGSFGSGILPESSQLSAESTAILFVGGWFDLFNNDVIDSFNRLRGEGRDGTVKLIVGPYDHGLTPPPCEMDFGEWNTLAVSTIMTQWTDRWMLNAPNGVENLPSVQFFLLGENRWMSSESWPPEGARQVSWYLDSDGSAGKNGGRLTPGKPSGASFDRYVYDPGNPVPTHGGILCCLRQMTSAGPFDQAMIEQREDVLLYTTVVLKEDITVAGNVRLDLFASTSARDTDFTGKLVDIHPDGKALNITDGIVRARFRNGDKPEFVTPGDVVEYSIDLGNTAITFKKGHRIGVEVSSSNFPRFDRNLNTGGRIGSEKDYIAATQTVYHTQVYPSRLVLPVVELDKE